MTDTGSVIAWRETTMHSINTFEILAREHERMLFAYVLSMVDDPQLAEDIVQETFLRAFQRLSSLRASDSFPAWIRAIARNQTIDQRVAANREIPTDPHVVQGMEDVFGRLDDPEAGDEWSARIGEIRACFELLPKGLREVCRLCYFEDRRAREIAGRLGVNEATVWKRLERARKALRGCVEKRLALDER